MSALPDDLLADPSADGAIDGLDRAAADDGRQVKWGSADESDRKVEVLAILLKENASVYDVSVPEQPTTRR